MPRCAGGAEWRGAFGMLLLAAMLLPVAHRAAAAGTARDINGQIAFGGIERTYLVHVPPSYNGRQAMPLLVVLHGAGGTGRGMVRLSHMDSVADRHGFLVVYPDGYQHGWADGRGASAADMQSVDDVGFIMALIDTLEQQYRIDIRAIGATGISNGGFFAQRLACEHADRFAAAASVAATLSAQQAANCRPQRAMPMQFFHGTDDPLVPYGGGSVAGGFDQVLSSDATLQRWATLDGCTVSPIVSAVPDRANDGMSVQRTSYAHCADKAAVVRYSITGGGHTWPGGMQYLPAALIGKTSRDIDASTLIWSFLHDHPLI